MTALLNISRYHAHNTFTNESKPFHSFEDCFAFVEKSNESQEDFGDTNYQPEWKIFAEVILTKQSGAKNGSKII